MPLSLADFVSQVEEEVKVRYDSYSRTEESMDWAFAQWILELLFPALDSDQAFSQLFRDTTWDIDAYHRDNESGIVFLVKAFYSDRPNDFRLGQGVLRNLAYTYRRIIDTLPNMDQVQPEWAEVGRALADGYSLSMVVALFGEWDETVDAKGLEGEYLLPDTWLLSRDIHELRRISAGLDIDISEGSIVLPFLACARYDGPVEALVGNVRATDFRQAIKDLVPQIYDANLRVPLGPTKINRQMKQTLDSSDRRFFWYYNNGITVLCRRFEPVAGAAQVFHIDSPRIVNGAQTTNAVLTAGLADHDRVDMMVRIIAALPGSRQVSDDLLDLPGLLEDLHLNIARFTNSQNPIEMPDFRSNELVQKRLFQEFKALGWFYQHRRGQWASSPDRTAFRNKRIDMVELAQRWFAFDGNPAVAIREKLSLFEEEGHYGSIFTLARSAEEFLVAYLIFEHVNDRLKDRIGKAKEERRTLDEGGRISITTQNYLLVGRATKLAAAHMTALLGRALRTRYGPMNRRLAQQILVPLLDGRLVKSVYAELEDTLFRFASRLRSETDRSLHRELSNKATFDELYDLFEYVLDREKDKGRDALAL